MKYAVIRVHEGKFGQAMMCAALDVSRSGYHDWRHRKPSQRAEANRVLDGKIRSIFEAEKGRPGARRIAKRLASKGDLVDRGRVGKRMKTMGLRAKATKKFKATTNSNHNLPVAPNLLSQDFSATRPNQKWVTDITYSTPSQRSPPDRG